VVFTYTPGGTLRGLTGFAKLKRKFVINAEWSGPDLGLATGDPDTRTTRTRHWSMLRYWLLVFSLESKLENKLVVSLSCRIGIARDTKVSIQKKKVLTYQNGRSAPPPVYLAWQTGVLYSLDIDISWKVVSGFRWSVLLVYWWLSDNLEINIFWTWCPWHSRIGCRCEWVTYPLWERPRTFARKLLDIIERALSYGCCIKCRSMTEIDCRRYWNEKR
jgi:hypothetical protein